MERKRHISFDVLNIVASFGVIAMHCNWIVHQYSDTIAWKQSLVVDVLFYWAVPVFFMISGATLIGYDKKYSSVLFLKKRVKKTVIPFFIWSMVAFAYQCITGAIKIQQITFKSFLNGIFLTEYMGVYWFFVPLFMTYMCIPVLSKLVDNKKILWYISGMAFMTYSVFPFLSTVTGIAWNPSFSFPMAGGYLMYTVLGWLLHNTDFSQKSRRWIYALGVFGMSVRYVGTYCLSNQETGVNTLFWEYMNWPSVCFAVAVFVFAEHVNWEKILKKEKIKELIQSLADGCFGIYLVHMYFINIIWAVFDVTGYSFVWRVFSPVVIYFLSLCTVKCIKRIPILKNIIP